MRFVQNNEQKTAADYCDRLGLPRTIAELTKERLRRAAAKIKADNSGWKGDTGFRVFKLDASSIRAWNPDLVNLDKTLLDHEEHILSGRTEGTLCMSYCSSWVWTCAYRWSLAILQVKPSVRSVAAY